MDTTNNDVNAVQIHRTLNLLVNSAIAVEMALFKKDLDELDAAIRAVKQNADAAQNLLLAWRAGK